MHEAVGYSGFNLNNWMITMNWDAIGAIGEIVGACGVIISLLYLAVQIRGDAKAKRAATVHDQSAAFRDLLRMLATDEGLAEVYLDGIRDMTSIKDSDLVRVGSTLGFMFRVFEESYFQWKEGHLDAHVWNGFEAPITDMLAYPGVQDWWATRSHWYGDQFREFIGEKISQATTPALYRENTSK